MKKVELEAALKAAHEKIAGLEGALAEKEKVLEVEVEGHQEDAQRLASKDNRIKLLEKEARYARLLEIRNSDWCKFLTVLQRLMPSDTAQGIDLLAKMLGLTESIKREDPFGTIAGEDIPQGSAVYIDDAGKVRIVPKSWVWEEGGPERLGAAMKRMVGQEVTKSVFPFD